MGQCLAPCIRRIDPFEYESMVDEIKSFLNGKTQFLESRLKNQMKYYADNLEFERAAEFKQLLNTIESITSKQKIIFDDHIDRDVVGYSIREGYICVVFLLYRKGVLLGKNSYIEEIEDDLEDMLDNIIMQFYSKHEKPKELILPFNNSSKMLSEALDIKTLSPTRGKKKDLLAMALANAKQMLDQHFQTARLDDDVLKLLEELQDKLGLSKTPLDIELYDNSHIQGYDCVGAMVKYINGQKAPQLYRKYHIQQENKQDDLASMEEVLTRRFKRLKEEKQKYPDLIIVDGGFNQCAIALKVKEEVGVDIPIAGLAKNEKHETDSLINADTGEVIKLNRNSPLFFLLMRMQDEVHRYAITFHRSLRNKSTFKTLYDDIEGIGKKRREKLLELFPSLESLAFVNVDELSQIVPKEIAEQIIKKRDELNKEFKQ